MKTDDSHVPQPLDSRRKSSRQIDRLEHVALGRGTAPRAAAIRKAGRYELRVTSAVVRAVMMGCHVIRVL